MSESVPPTESTSTRWSSTDIVWVIVLIISIAVGFGLTIFAPI